jgi:hypothetical protein
VSFLLQRQFNRLITSSMLVLTLAAVAPSVLASSSLSGWLSRDVVPELRKRLSQHPRYQGQRIQIEDGDQNGLSEAIGTVLNNNLAGRDGIILIAPGQTGLPQPAAPVSIDALDCVDTGAIDYLLQVSTNSGQPDHDSVQLTLMEVSSGGKQPSNWHWQGRFSSTERKQFEKTVAAGNATGSLRAPWRDQDVNAAAVALSRDFACALRPQIQNRLVLQWIQADELPALFADTANTMRHKLGDYRELAIGEVQPDYAVDVRIERFRDDIWQLWVTGSPHDKDLAPVQAVTYFKSSSPQAASAFVNLAAEPVARPAAQENLGQALSFIDVQMVDATQSEKRRSRADLQVTLRISNRAQQPIAYSFTLSGGHFERCIAEPRYYRHDDYGLLLGRLEAGASVMRRLVIENAQHRPTPLYGMPKCAGFRDLQGFEEFASQGYKVTDYVRWDM